MGQRVLIDEVLEWLGEHSDTSVSEIAKGLDANREDTRLTVQELMRRKKIRQKEDRILHDWVYRIVTPPGE